MKYKLKYKTKYYVRNKNCTSDEALNTPIICSECLNETRTVLLYGKDFSHVMHNVKAFLSYQDIDPNDEESKNLKWKDYDVDTTILTSNVEIISLKVVKP